MRNLIVYRRRTVLQYKVWCYSLFIFLCCSPILAQAENIPQSQRSKKVVSEITPSLVRALEQQNLNLGSPIFIRIFKEEAELEVWVQGLESSTPTAFQLFKTYPICSFSGKLGPKLKTGDNQSPEGFYFVSAKQLNPWSRFHLSFNLGYPNRYDRFHNRTGSYLMVHGDCVSIGCYAMTDDNMEEIYTLAQAALQKEQPFFRVHIFPFRMTSDNMERHRQNSWFHFWENLKTGYDWFEEHKQPPNVEVSAQGRYVFDASQTIHTQSTRSSNDDIPLNNSPHGTEVNQPSVNGLSPFDLSQAALERTQHTVRYDGSYLSIQYPNGDVPPNIGVCTDVVIRAYRTLGIDLQQLVHEDMRAHFNLYPKNWGLKRPDTNIDHRRVPNLQTFFTRHGLSLSPSLVASHYLPGDLVTWMLPGNLPHIGIVVDKYTVDGTRPMIVHNIGQGPQLEDMLFDFQITGHYRFLPQ